MTIANGYQEWGLDLADLTEAVLTTQEEAHDLHQNNSTGSLERVF